MKVHLKRNWNAPGDHLFFVRDSPVEVDDDLLPYIPSDAHIDGKTRNETRTTVLVERRKQGLDKVTAELPSIALTSDEDLLAAAEGKGKKAPVSAAEEAAADKEKHVVDRKTLDANLATAKANLENAQKKLANAKTEPEKGVAKADVELAEKGINEAEGAILTFEDGAE